jgi:shikimate dehydrogenase
VNEPGRLVLLGHPVSHSLSPVIQNAALAVAGIALSYETLDVEPAKLASTLSSLRAEKAAGNITIPYKEAAAGLIAHLSPLAERVGAVNTFTTGLDGELNGHNTDVAGFAELVRTVLGKIPTDARFAIVGSGGSAGAVLAAIETWKGCTATIYARSAERAANLVRRFSNVSRVETLRPGEPITCDIVVNATPIGLNDEQMPLPLELLPPNTVVLDLVYRSTETAWVRVARASGRAASDGLPMLVEQGAVAFETWFGVAPSREAMWQAVTTATGRSAAEATQRE